MFHGNGWPEKIGVGRGSDFFNESQIRDRAVICLNSKWWEGWKTFFTGKKCNDAVNPPVNFKYPETNFLSS